LKFGLAGNLPANLMHENPVQFAEMDMFSIPVPEELFDMQTPWIICCHFIMKLQALKLLLS